MPISISSGRNLQAARMEKMGKIIRRSIYTFLQNYHYFTTTPVFLLLPFSASVLLSQALFSSSSPLLMIILARFNSLLHAAGFSPSSQFVLLLNLNLSQTIISTVFSFPFALSSLIVAKASVIQALQHCRPYLQPSPPSFISLYKPLLQTHLCNSFLFTTSTIAALSLLSVVLNSLEAVGFSSNNPFLLLAVQAVFYSSFTNTVVICNVALTVAGMENSTGYPAIVKAFLLWRDQNSTALLLALIVNVNLAAVQALFNYRIVRAYYLLGSIDLSMALEGLFITYLYSLLIVLDTIASCLFFKICKSNLPIDQTSRCYHVEVDNSTSSNSKTPEDFP